MALYQVVRGATSAALDPNQYDNLLTGTMTDQQVTISNRIRATTTGATTTSGYVGGTNFAIPASGTFAAGDMVADPGLWGMWVCNTSSGGGAPQGSWYSVGTCGYVARVHQVTPQTLNYPPGTLGNTIIAFDTTDYDPSGLWSGAPSYQFTIPWQGMWRFIGAVHRIGTNTTTPARIDAIIFVNGVEAVRGDDVSNSFFPNAGGGCVIADLYLQVNSAVTLGAFDAVSGDTTDAQSSRTYFCARLLNISKP